jgi:Flp pilus assembly protein CpaB
MPVPSKTSLKTFLISAARQWRQLLHSCVSQLERERRAQVATIAVISVLTAGFVAESVVATRRERNSWSHLAAVLVLTAPVRAGDELTAQNTTTVELPHALIAVDALYTIAPNTRSRIALAANTPLTRSLTIPSSDAVVIPEGWRVIALPSDVVAPVVQPGDAIDLIVGSTVVATNSVVVSASPLTVAVPADVVPAITRGARVGDVSVAAGR